MEREQSPRGSCQQEGRPTENISSQLRSQSKERVTNLLLKSEGREDRRNVNGGHIELYNEILKLEEQRNKSPHLGGRRAL
jgi:hypothetical protein